MVVVGDWIPRSLFGRLHLLFAAVKAIYLALYMLFIIKEQCDLILADQITFHLPLLKCCSRYGVLFYCHFPDKLLAPKNNTSTFNAIYRRILDWAEEACLRNGAKCVLVNSQFTLLKFEEAFKTLNSMKPEILYPGVHIDNTGNNNNNNHSILLSLNRFERKKDLHLAIEAYYQCHQAEIKLVVAGGYDQRVTENVEHLQELQALCNRLGLKHTTVFRKDDADFLNLLSNCQVLFLPSVSQETKITLLQQSRSLLYTPSNEHFGIVPLEAMACGLPVVAMNSGGPKETVSKDSGVLSEPNAEDLAKCIGQVLGKGKEEFKGRERVAKMFSMEIFGDRLDQIVRSLCKNKWSK